MAKKKFLMDEDEMDAILDSDIAALDQGHSDQKILDIVRAGGQGLTAAQDFYEIPVDQIDPFSLIGASDFSRWSGGEGQAAVPAFRQYGGSFEPIIVRQKQGSHRFELIAGEQRLRVTRAAGAKTITARVIRNCSDSEALDIFALTNIQRRSTTISDQIYGWGLVVENHTNQGARSDLGAQDTLSAYIKGMQTSRSQVYRYLALRALVPELLPALDSGKLSIRAGEKVAALSPEHQRAIAPYIHLVSEATGAQLVALEKSGWDTDAAAEIITGRKKTRRQRYDSSMRTAMLHARKYVAGHFSEACYDDLSTIIVDALEAWLEQHPEMRKGR